MYCQNFKIVLPVKYNLLKEKQLSEIVGMILGFILMVLDHIILWVF